MTRSVYGFTFEEDVLTAEQYLTLRESVGWTGVTSQIEKALEKGLFNVLARDGEKVIAMGRLVGDGVMYWYLQDVIVHPYYQGNGLGKHLVERLLRHVEETKMPGTTASVCLMSALGKEEFYVKLGFTRRPNERFGAGMIKQI